MYYFWAKAMSTNQKILIFCDFCFQIGAMNFFDLKCRRPWSVEKIKIANNFRKKKISFFFCRYFQSKAFIKKTLIFKERL